MCATRRTTSTRLTRLTAEASPYHAAVTLYEAPARNQLEPDVDSETQAGPSNTRRLRIKREPVMGETPALEVPDDRTAAIPRRLTSRGVKPRAQTKEPDRKPSRGPSELSRKKPRSKSKPVQILRELDVPHPPPDGWAGVYDAIKAMRARVVAPVDTMGCDQAQWGEREPKNQRFATLVSLMLSSQTKDEVTDAAVAKLRTALGGSISIQAVLAADEGTIAESIAKVGFWRRKTQYIRETARRLQDDFDSDVPKTAEELCSLPGVGPKMAFLALQVAWKLNVGIGVDIHVHRITNRLGWHNTPTKTPEETRVNLESWLPKALHGEINHLLVGFGQTICLPVAPRCSECTLSSEGLCPSALCSKDKSKSRRKSKSKSKSKSKVLDATVEEDCEPKIKIEVEPEGLMKQVAGHNI